MSPLALRVGGIILGILLGAAGAKLADALPRRYEIVRLASAERRKKRNAAVIMLVAGCGAAIGEVLVGAKDLGGAHAVTLLVTNLLVVTAVVSAAAIDLEHMILPDELTLGGALVCLVSSPFRSIGWKSALAGAAIGFAVAYVPFLLYKRVRKRSGMGLGDAKLTLLAGAWFGPLGAVLVVFVGLALMLLATAMLRVLRIEVPVPESVAAEITELRRRAEAGDAAARDELEDDPMAAEVGAGALGMRLPLGPFLAAACLLLLFTRRTVEPAVLAWLRG